MALANRPPKDELMLTMLQQAKSSHDMKQLKQSLKFKHESFNFQLSSVAALHCNIDIYTCTQLCLTTIS